MTLQYLPNISSTNPGKKINFVKHQDVASQYKGQLSAYQGVFGCNLLASQPWQSTLFRLPLRSAELAANSNISKQTYTVEKVQELMEQLMMESCLIMLFLKYITNIQVRDWPWGGLQACLTS